jgi:hypothetical protein
MPLLGREEAMEEWVSVVLDREQHGLRHREVY